MVFSIVKKHPYSADFDILLREEPLSKKKKRGLYETDFRRGETIVQRACVCGGPSIPDLARVNERPPVLS